MVEEFEMIVTTDYILEPDTSLLKVQSTLKWKDDSMPLEMGSFFMVAKDIAEVWNPTGGRLESGDHSWKGLLSKDNQLSLGLFSEGQNFGSSLTQGLLEDETRGLTTSSSRREVPSSVFGINTPGPIDKAYSNRQQNSKNARLGGTSFVMDDGDDKFVRKVKASEGAYEYVNVESMDQETYAGAEKQANVPHNELFRIRTRTGHQILLHNSEDLVYIANANGTAWIEMTANGKIDFYAEDSVSVHSKGDFNFKTDRDFNLQAGRDINLKSATVNQESTTHNVLVSGAQTVEVIGQQTITTGNTNHYANGNINLDVGGLVNIANGIAVATPVSPLATWSLPGEANPTIMKRVPQHEPWSHHENYDPMAVALIKTDRSEQEDIVVAEPINIPDTFKNVRT